MTADEDDGALGAAYDARADDSAANPPLASPGALRKAGFRGSSLTKGTRTRKRMGRRMLHALPRAPLSA